MGTDCFSRNAFAKCTMIPSPPCNDDFSPNQTPKVFARSIARVERHLELHRAKPPSSHNLYLTEKTIFTRKTQRAQRRKRRKRKTSFFLPLCPSCLGGILFFDLCFSKFYFSLLANKKTFANKFQQPIFDLRKMNIKAYDTIISNSRTFSTKCLFVVPANFPVPGC